MMRTSPWPSSEAGVEDASEAGGEGEGVAQALLAQLLPLINLCAHMYMHT